MRPAIAAVLPLASFASANTQEQTGGAPLELSSASAW